VGKERHVWWEKHAAGRQEEAAGEVGGEATGQEGSSVDMPLGHGRGRYGRKVVPVQSQNALLIGKA
jgi:hypothetical protein